MIPSHDDGIEQSGPAPEPLGRAWVGPALLIAGGLSLARAEVLVRLGVHHGADSVETARWVALAQWPALVVQSALMAAATAAVVWSARGLRLVAGVLIGAAFLTSAITGWPVAPMEQILQGIEEGLPNLIEIGVAGALVALVLATLALICRRSVTPERVMGSPLFLVIVALPALGIPSYLLWQDSLHVPQMPVREVVGELHDAEHWTAIRQEAGAPVRLGRLNPNSHIEFERDDHDAIEKTALLMSPPSEVQIEIPSGAEGASLSLAAQISGSYTSRAASPDAPGESELDKLELDAVSVRFQVLVDGSSVFDSVIRHGHEDRAVDRVWQFLDFDVSPGQVMTLRTDFGDEASAHAFDGRELQCGFSDLVLDRWNERPRTHANPEEPNILFITIDTLRADRLSSYGYEKPTTPHMDALAREGLLFERAFATSSWTWPSTASLFTGLLPYDHGVLSGQDGNLNYAHETLAEALQDGGFTTAAITANPMIDGSHQFDQGFESFDSAQHLRMGEELIDGIESKLRELSNSRFYFYVHLVDPQVPHRPLESELKRLGGKRPEDFENPVIAGSTIDGMFAYARRIVRGDATDEFGVIHPNTVVPESHASWISDRYDASVGTADQYVGRILMLLSELGLDETTVIALTSDHGEELLDHNMYGHGHTLHRELVHIPLMLAGPGVPSGVRVGTEVSNRHLAPTLAKIGGARMEAVTDAIDLLDRDAPASSVFYQTGHGYWNGHRDVEVQGLREDGHVVHHAPQGGVWNGPPTDLSRTRLFHIESDVREHIDLAFGSNYKWIASALVESIEASVEKQVAGHKRSALDDEGAPDSDAGSSAPSEEE